MSQHWHIQYSNGYEGELTVIPTKYQSYYSAGFALQNYYDWRTSKHAYSIGVFGEDNDYSHCPCYVPPKMLRKSTV